MVRRRHVHNDRLKLYVVIPAPAILIMMCDRQCSIETFLVDEHIPLAPSEGKMQAECTVGPSGEGQSPEQQEIASLKAELAMFRQHIALKAEIQMLRDHRLDDMAHARVIYRDLSDRYERIRELTDATMEAQRIQSNRYAMWENAKWAVDTLGERERSATEYSDDEFDAYLMNMAKLHPFNPQLSNEESADQLEREVEIQTQLRILVREVEGFTKELVCIFDQRV